MTTCICIDPDGTVTPLSGRLLDLGREAFDGMTSVVVLHHPMVADLLVGCVHDWGLVKGLPLNRRAWTLYGRSPIYGPMFVALDEGDELPEEFIEAFSSTALTPEMNALMDAFLDQHPEFPRG